ncbi:PP2C family protein-serine/threonine phosphatase, partial [Streptomyces sp. NPDC046859]|uniref:PP2C family protein-serine/threonine phosphatase n=1 Tax=Streptomyces sp. NPDC046859 TaxID=3155734 RepID=UPI0033FF886F
SRHSAKKQEATESPPETVPHSGTATGQEGQNPRASTRGASQCTAVFGTIDSDPVAGRLTVHLASGGHPPALVLRADGTAAYLPTPGGLLVGVLPTAPFTAAATTLDAGDTLLLYTDGLTEARTGKDRTSLYGDEALLDFAATQAGRPPHAVIEALGDLLSGFGDGLDDDTALLAIGVPTTRRPDEPHTMSRT